MLVKLRCVIIMIWPRVHLLMCAQAMHGVDDKYLLGASTATVRSLNGTRVADAILQNVPHPPTFKIALRLLKYWMKKRGLYGNKLGYLGGVQIAILTARICQLYPRATASTIVVKFFKVLLVWAKCGKWSPEQPIMLVEQGPKEGVEWQGLNADIWRVRGEAPPAAAQPHSAAASPQPRACLRHPKLYLNCAPRYACAGLAETTGSSYAPRSRQRVELLPILTPAYPSMNSTFNINESTKRILLQELERGQKIAAQIELAQAGGSSMQSWGELVEQSDFFTRYKSFVRVDIVAGSEDGHRSWKGLAESQLRMFVDSLEGGASREHSPLHAHIYPQGFSWSSLWQEGVGWPEHVQNPPSRQFADTFFIGVEKKQIVTEGRT
jgi:poly(A) polymerase